MNTSTNVKHCQQKVFQQKNLYCVYNADLVSEFTPAMLSPQYWQSRNSVLGTAQGRGTTYFVTHQNQQWVLRHYFRGGLVGKFNRDSYLFTGIENTRAAREFALLCQLNALNLPAPIPVAFCVKRRGIHYQADILTARIENAQDLVAILSEKSLDEQLWHAIGKCIAEFHQQGIFHHDLNAHNILIDDHHKVWIIDFDQGEQRNVDKKWQQANLDRLLRSFEKENNKLVSFHWRKEHWQSLLSGYLNSG